MAKAILFVRVQGIQFDILDINMGCHAPKITGQRRGQQAAVDPAALRADVPPRAKRWAMIRR